MLEIRTSDDDRVCRVLVRSCHLSHWECAWSSVRLDAADHGIRSVSVDGDSDVSVRQFRQTDGDSFVCISIGVVIFCADDVCPARVVVAALQLESSSPSRRDGAHVDNDI